MAIKGVSDIRRFPRAGKIHLGIKATNDKGKEYPRAVDYFVLPDDRPDLVEIFGDKPRELTIMFPTDDLETVAPQYFKRYGSGTGLVCKGDGITASMVNTETGEFEEIECPGLECDWFEPKKQCRHIMNLQFLIPDFISDGVWQLDTSSFFSIVNFNGSWDFIRTLTGGQIAMIPLLLRVVPKECSPGGKKKIVHVLELKLAERYSLSQLQAITTSTPTPVAALPEPDLTTEPEHFYPSEVRPEPEHDSLPETNDPIVDDLGAQMEPDEMDLEIEALMKKLGLTQAQQMIYRKKAGSREALLDRLIAERDGKSNVRELRPEASTAASADPEAPPETNLPGTNGATGTAATTAPAAPSRPKKSYI
jgi:hypothetical protein